LEHTVYHFIDTYC